MTATEPQPAVTDGDSDLGYRIVQEVARAEGSDPLELDAPLYEVVNVDALAALVRSANEDIQASFRYLEYRVVVTGDGTVTVHDRGSGDASEAGK